MINVYQGTSMQEGLTTTQRLQILYQQTIERMRGYREVRDEELTPPRCPTVLFSRILEMRVTMAMIDRFSRGNRRQGLKTNRK
jgi:hypothetical protein